jgi:hypothetical protein
MFNTISRRSVVLIAGFGAALTLAACDSAGSVTQPASAQKSLQPRAHHDDSDSSGTCLSGYLDTSGRWVCAS